MAKLTDKKGVVLIATYLALSVLLIFVVVFFNVSTVHNLAANFFARRAQAFNLAEAGLDRSIKWFRTSSSPGSCTDPWGGVQSLGSGTYTVTVTDRGSPGGVTTIHRYKVVSTGRVGSITRTLTSYVQTDNYAQYIWFTNSELFQGSNVWFWSQDTLNGPVHTNGNFNIYGTPTFKDTVESVDSYINYYNNGDNENLIQLSNPPYDLPNFQGGATLGANKINMPTQDLNLRAASTDGGLRLQGDTTIVLNSNGTMNVTNSKKGWNNNNMALPGNGALFVDSGKLTISGTLKGRLSVGASQDIIIPSDIKYAKDPRVDSSSTDTLGIVSEQDVMIPSSAHTNIEIDASIMALNTSFYLQDWSTVAAKGNLTVFGGIIQNQRGPVGTFNAATNTKLSGYSKIYTYDTRLLSNPPPFVPTTGDYIVLSWEDQ